MQRALFDARYIAPRDAELFGDLTLCAGHPAAEAVTRDDDLFLPLGQALVHECLTEREEEVIISRYGLGGRMPRTQREVAKKLGISRSYVSRIEKRALQKLEEALGERE